MQKRKGISLIVLVITIIVMTILVGAIVLTLNNSGIIAKATDAVEQTNLATVKELTQMAWAEAYAGGERTEEGLKAAVDEALADSKIDINKYKIEVTTSGVTVELKGESKFWRQQGLTVTNGEVIVEVGDYINYNSGAIAKKYDFIGDYEYEQKQQGIYEEMGGRWQILGANEQGELLIMSSMNVDILHVGPSGSGADPHEEIEKLNQKCQLYGNGSGATGSRSVRVDDINRITAYDKMTYGKGTINEYGNKVTYYWTGEDYPKYVAENGISGYLKDEEGNSDYFGEMSYYDEDKNRITSSNNNGTEENPEKIVTLEATYYSYNITDTGIIKNGSKAYNMLYGEKGFESDDEYLFVGYWLGDECTYIGESTVSYEMFSVAGDGVGSDGLLGAGGLVGEYLRGIRPVISLDKDIKLTGSSESGWSY